MINQLLRSLVEFCDYCRKSGLNVGVKETLDAVEIIKLDMFYQKHILKWSLRTVLCSNREEFEKFEKIFNDYWIKKSNYELNDASENKSEMKIFEKPKRMISLISYESSNDDDTKDNESAASTMERLRKTDFSRITMEDEELLHVIAEQLWKQMTMRILYRYKKSNRKKQIDIRSTIRHNISKGGVPINLKYRAKKKVKPKLVIFLDVSGSMDRYSFFLLRFIFILHSYFEKVSTFIFSTRLLNISPLLAKSKLEDALLLVEEEADIWSSGTTIGESFFQFNQNFAGKTMHGKPIVLVFSDGLETGNVDHLYNQLSKIKSKAKNLIWVTPLLGMQNYQPITKGLTAILPLFDKFTSSHNIDSLLKLEKYLTDVL